ncbi:MAG: Mpv17/PMP22 family protein [Nanoarchaeota archaeon]
MDLSSLVQTAFEHYRAFNEANPITGSILTAGVIFPSADITSQLITDKTVHWRKVRYTTGLVPWYGAWAYVSVRSGDVVEAYISEQPLAKAALGPNLIGPLFNLFFFLNNGVGEKSNYSLQALGRHYRSFFQKEKKDDTLTTIVQRKLLDYIPKKEYWNSFIGTLTFWNAFQYVNYSYIPQELQTPATLGVAFGWTVLLSLWSLGGGRKLISNTQP